MVDFGVRLKELRKENGMTQRQLAERLGVTKSMVSYYELSERFPSPEILIRLAKVFRTTTDSLLGLEKNTGFIDVGDLDEKQKRLLMVFLEALRDRG
ncbi:MAG: helix-turn-helix domain-containing protein [Clostridia bacterium]|nr:helix-turn-helix domain-containing protein [Clostridia bacterium]